MAILHSAAATLQDMQMDIRGLPAELHRIKQPLKKSLFRSEWCSYAERHEGSSQPTEKYCNKNIYAMFKSITRPEIFRASVFADNLVALFQKSYETYIDRSVKWEADVLKNYYDHLQPFQPIEPPIDSHCVLAYDAQSKKDYIENFPLVLQQFLTALAIQDLYLTYFNKKNLFRFEFENFRKRNLFKLYGGRKTENLAYQIKVSDLHKGLPLFFFSGVYDVPVIFLITANGKVPLSLRLCDDGNLHLNFQEMYQKRIHEAAIKVGFKTGDLEICVQYRLHNLD